VPKSRLIEKIADLMHERKLPLVADIRDESAEDVRVVIEPRSRTVDATMMMESLFKLTELERPHPAQHERPVGGTVPRVIGLAEALREWLDHRREVLVRRSRHRLGKIDHRLEILTGLLIVYLDLDRVIKIIREEDEPKEELMKFFKLTELQANAILDMRLRSLRKLEEMELKREFDELTTEKGQVEALLASEDKQWKVVAHQIREVRKSFGRRRRSASGAPPSTARPTPPASISRRRWSSASR
jgi:topoisomerase IV subunit A